MPPRRRARTAPEPATIPGAPAVGTGPIRYLSRPDFLTELTEAFEPGEHLCLIGPTGRGKSVLTAQLVQRLRRFTTIALLTPKGADPAFHRIGHVTRSWPPRRNWVDDALILFGLREDRHRGASEPKIWRVQVGVRSVEDFGSMAVLYARVLASTLARRENPRDGMLVVLDDSRFLSDQMRLAKIIVANMMIGRSKKVSMVNNFQAPRWVPRECMDQATHMLIWRNRDGDVVKRLTELSGDVDLDVIDTAIRGLGYHECLWINGKADTVAIVAAN